MTPVVLAPALGAAEDVVALLGAAALPLRVHARIAAWLDAYARVGLPLPTARAGRATFRGSPAQRRGGGLAARGPQRRGDRPAAHGAPVRRHRRWRSSPTPPAGCASSAAFALADHGDLPSLVAHARAAEARDVWLTSGFSDAAARAFAAAGMRAARALGAPAPMQQMALFGD